MKENNVLKSIGEKFGSAIVELVRVNRAFTVTVLEVDDTYAYVTMTGGKEKMSVPLTCTSINFGYLKVTPTLDSIAIVTLANGADNAPFFIAFSEVDEITLTIGESTVRINTDVWVFNGGTLGGLTKTQELKTQLDKVTARIDGIIDAINNGVPSPGAADGGAALQTSIKAALALLVNVEDFSNIENEKITQ